MHTQHNKNIALSLGILPIETNERNETNERKHYRDKVFIKTVKHAMSVFLFVFHVWVHHQRGEDLNRSLNRKHVKLHVKSVYLRRIIVRIPN